MPGLFYAVKCVMGQGKGMFSETAIVKNIPPLPFIKNLNTSL